MRFNQTKSQFFVVHFNTKVPDSISQTDWIYDSGKLDFGNHFGRISCAIIGWHLPKALPDDLSEASLQWQRKALMTGQESRRSPDAKSGFFYGYIIVVAALCIMAANYGARYTFGIFFKPILTEFGWTRAMISGAFSLSQIMDGLLGIVMGGLTDRLGPRIVLTFCSFLIGLGYLLMSQVSAVWQLYLFYGVIVGIGMSGTWVPILSTVARWFVERRSQMTGIVMIGTGIGILIAPPVADRLISIYDWRMSYIILGSVVLIVVLLAAQFLRRDPAKMGQVSYGESKVGERKLQFGTEGLSLKESVVTRQFWVVFVMLFCFGFCHFTVVVHIVPHATDLGTPTTAAASILSTLGGLAIVGRLVLGSASDRIGSRLIFIIGFVLMSAALFWLISAIEMWMLYLFAVIYGFAQGGMGASHSPLVAELFVLSSHGLILGVSVVGYTIGAALGPFLAGYIFDVAGSYQTAFLICAALTIIGLILAIILKPVRDAREK